MEGSWLNRERKEILIVAGCLFVFIFLLCWFNDPNKSAPKIKTEVTKRYIGNKEAYIDIKVHCQDFIDTCGCGQYELFLDVRDRFSQRCNIFWREDKQYGYFNDRQEAILRDFMMGQHIAGALIYPDSISFVYSDLAYQDQHVRLTLTKHQAPHGSRLDSNAYYYW
jgi:hypothetical protein